MVKQNMANPSNTSKTSLPHFVVKRVSEGSFILVLTTALFVLLSLITYHRADASFSNHLTSSTIHNAGGHVGAFVADALFLMFGYLAYLLPLCFAYVAWMILKDHRALRVVDKPVLMLRGIGLLMMVLGGCGLLAVLMPVNEPIFVHGLGGLVGQFVATALNKALNIDGATLSLFAMFLVGVTWLTGLSWIYVTEMIGCYTLILVGMSMQGFRFSM